MSETIGKENGEIPASPDRKPQRCRGKGFRNRMLYGRNAVNRSKLSTKEDKNK